MMMVDSSMLLPLHGSLEQGRGEVEHGQSSMHVRIAYQGIARSGGPLSPWSIYYTYLDSTTSTYRN